MRCSGSIPSCWRSCVRCSPTCKDASRDTKTVLFGSISINNECADLAAVYGANEVDQTLVKGLFMRGSSIAYR